MNLTDEEIALAVEWRDARAAFLKAKKARDKHPDDYETAKAKVDKLRTYWRQIGEAVPEGHPGHRNAVAPIGRNR